MVAGLSVTVILDDITVETILAVKQVRDDLCCPTHDGVLCYVVLLCDAVEA
jgi:hypothetical protein